MNRIILHIVLLLHTALAFGQSNVRVELRNQYALNDKLYFDLYLRTTDGSAFHLNQSGFALSFDTLAFNNPRITFDPAMTTLKNVDGTALNGVNVSATILKDLANRNVILINYLAPYVGTAQQVRASTAYIDSRLDVHRLGRFVLSGYNQSMADVNLRVVTVARSRSHYSTKILSYNADGTNGNPGNIDGTADSVFVYLNLGQFTALPSGRSAELEWTTQNEVRMNSFEIERSIYVDRDFVRVGSVPSKGFPNTLSVYRVIDRDVYNPLDPIPTYYYRIKYIAEDGSSAYSPVRAVNFNEFNEIEMVTWPNPTSDAVNLQMRNVVDETIIVRLLSRNGSELGQKIFSPNDIIRFEVANVAPGVYFLEVITSKGKRTEKVVVWR